MASDTEKTWDQRLTEAWAHKAREAANHPGTRNRPSFREQVRSSLYLAGTAALGAGILISLLSGHNSTGGIIAVAVGYVGYFVALAIAQRRWRRRQAP